MDIPFSFAKFRRKHRTALSLVASVHSRLFLLVKWGRERERESEGRRRGGVRCIPRISGFRSVELIKWNISCPGSVPRTRTLQSQEIRNRTATLCRAPDRIYDHGPLGVWITVSILRNRENRRITRRHAKFPSLHVYIRARTSVETTIARFIALAPWRSESLVINDCEGWLLRFRAIFIG